VFSRHDLGKLLAPWRDDPWNLALHAVLVLAAIALFLTAHAAFSSLPSPPSETGGWQHWSDQAKYIEAARAWSAWDLAPQRHWYPPGYSLLAAPFLAVTPHDRFLLPNLLCLVLCQVACVFLATRLFPTWRYAGLVGSAAFLVASVGTARGLESWLVPWTSTPAAAATLLALVAGLHLVEQPSVRRALYAGAALGAGVLFRPGDVLPVAIAVSAIAVPALWHVEPKRALAIAGAALVGALATSVTAIALILATTGFGAGTYYAVSSRFGFEPSLIAVQWVTLIVSGNPLYDGLATSDNQAWLHVGLAQMFPWIVPGIGGIAARFASGKVRAVHVLLGLWLAGQLTLLLAYRDLHLQGFWLSGNYHYFKATQPIVLLFALGLIELLTDRRMALRCGAAALTAVIFAFGWRASLAPIASVAVPPTTGTLRLPSLDRLDDIDIIPGTLPSWRSQFDDVHTLTIAGKRYANSFDFRIYERRNDLLIVPLRQFRHGPGLLQATGLTVRGDAPLIVGRQHLAFGLPCLFDLAGRAYCEPQGAPVLH
jgi:hypothetical protein